MNARQKAAKAVDDSLSFLNDRKGFDDWWWNLDGSVRDELLQSWISELEYLFKDDEN